MNVKKPLITTLKDRCRLCYTCVRDCPAKAIRISEGQAEVLRERCIGCGNCVKVCSQNAKEWYDSTAEVRDVLASSTPKAAIVAPSFPASFTELDHTILVGMIRALGFDYVSEVSFGADLVAMRYRKLLEEQPDKRYIATSCPGIVAYVEKYHPELVPMLAPLVSPMIAEARVLRRLHGEDLSVVFIGPCLAKKVEASRKISEGVKAVLTFVELRKMFDENGIKPETVEPSDFDPPKAALGALFPISGGMLQAADIKEDLLTGEVVRTEGKSHFAPAIREFETGDIGARLLETLCCHGCVMGTGMTSTAPHFSRRYAVSRYVKKKISSFDRKKWEEEVRRFDDLDLSCDFILEDQRLPLPSKEEIDKILAKMGKLGPEDELDCGACGYSSCREHAIAIHKGMAENEMCLPYTIERLKKSLKELRRSNEQLATTKHDLNESHEQLVNTQQALFNAEKLASMGQLSAGIAHEVNNPLGVILLFANNLLDEISESNENYEDLKMISEQAERCKKIVAGLLNFARKNKIVAVDTDLRDLLKRCLKGIVIPANIKISVDFGLEDPVVQVDPDQIIQVVTNLVRNAVEAMPGGGSIDIKTLDKGEQFQILVSDDGAGIPKENLNKVFEPLFTTKQIGKGTGLGLAVIYGIIKMHQGDIGVESNANPEQGATGTIFTVTLPKMSKQDLAADFKNFGKNYQKSELL